jgi:Ca-activated chloride channel family protein
VDTTLYVQDLNTSVRYLTGKYDLEFLTIPRRIVEGVELLQSKTTEIKLPNQGKLRLIASEPGFTSIYEKRNGVYEKVYDCYLLGKRELLNVLPGKYLIVYKPKSSYDCEITSEKYINISSNVMLTVTL